LKLFDANQVKRINKFNLFKFGIFLLVLYFTFVLRVHNFDRTPGPGHLEEMAFAWSGIYLIETGVPVSWSTLDYPKKAEVYKGRVTSQGGGEPYQYVTLQKPWLDQPPLFSLIVGAFGHFYKADRTQIIPPAYIRTPTVFMALLTAVLVFLIASSLSGFWIGILSMLFYGTVPILVFASRMAVPENLIAMVFLTIILLILNFQKNPKFLWLLPIPFLVGIAGLSKPTGFLILPFVLYFAFCQKFYKSAVYLILATIPFIVFFFAWGFHFDKEIFLHITAIQSLRPVGFSSLAWFFTSPAYDINLFLDSWYVFGLLAAVYFIFKPEEDLKRIVSFAFVYWLIIVMISGGEGDLLPWYRFPAFPLLAIFIAWGVKLLVEKANSFTTFLAAGFLLGNRHLLVNAFRPNISPFFYRVTLSGLLFPSLTRTVFEKKFVEKLCKLVIIGIVIVGVYLNVIYIYNRFELECENISCPFNPSTNLSSIHFPFVWRFFVLGEPKYK